MSALPAERDICWHGGQVSFVPRAAIRPNATVARLLREIS
jgi:hypothetical protein